METEPTVIAGYRSTGTSLRLELIYERSGSDQWADVVVSERAQEVAVSVLLKALASGSFKTADLRYGVVTVALSQPLDTRQLVDQDGNVLRRWSEYQPWWRRFVLSVFARARSLRQNLDQ